VNEGRKIDSLLSEVEGNIHHIDIISKRYRFIPLTYTNDDIARELSDARQALSNLSKGYVPTTTQEEENLSDQELHEVLLSVKTDRKGLQSLYAKSTAQRFNTPVYVIFTGKLSHTQLAKRGTSSRITFTDVEIREYNPNVSFEDSPIVETIDHLNFFPDDKTSKFIAEADPSEPFLGRLIYYRRKDSTLGTTFDFGITVRQWAPVDTWLSRIKDILDTWEGRLERGSLLKSSKYISRINTHREIFADPDNVRVNTKTTTLDDVYYQYNLLIARYDELYEIYQDLVDTKETQSD